MRSLAMLSAGEVNKMSSVRHYLMKATVSEAQWESTFLTPILTLEREK